MPFAVGGGGGMAYDPQLLAGASYYQQPVQSIWLQQPGVTGGGAAIPLQQFPAAATTYMQPYVDPSIYGVAQPPLAYPQQAYDPNQAYLPQQQQFLPQQQQFLPQQQQQLLPQQYYDPSQAYAQPQAYDPSQAYAAQQSPYIQPQAAYQQQQAYGSQLPYGTGGYDPTMVDPSTGGGFNGGFNQGTADPYAGAASTGASSGPGGMDLSGLMTGITQAVASITQLLAGMNSQSSQQSTGSPSSAPQSSGEDLPPPPSSSTPPPVSSSGTNAGSAPTPSQDTPPIPTSPAPTQSPTQGPPPTGNNSQFNSAPLTVKGAQVNQEQRDNIRKVLDVGKQMGASPKAMRAAIATIIVESTARNLNGGDRDSVGLFQQRPSCGWGTVAECTDPQHAATKFFERAIAADTKNPGLSMNDLAQKVQGSGTPNAYGQWESEANAAASAYGA